MLLRRDPDGKVSFHVLSPLTFRLLERLEQTPDLSDREQLEGLASEAGAQDTGAFIHDGAAMLAQLRREGTLLGTRPWVAATHRRLFAGDEHGNCRSELGGTEER